MAIQFWACGLSTGKTKRYLCTCCGFESDDIEQFATVYCWECAFGECEHGDGNDVVEE